MKLGACPGVVMAVASNAPMRFPTSSLMLDWFCSLNRSAGELSSALNLVANIIGAILFLVMGIALIVGFAFNYSIEEELQQVMMSNILL